jgi:hypothetical protein
MTQTTTRKSGVRAALVAGLALGALAAAQAARAQTAHRVHIPAGPLDAALITLADQTHEQLLYTPRLVAGRSAAAVDGELTAEQALARMIHAGDIVVSRTGPSTVVLRAASAASGPGATPAATPSDLPSRGSAALSPLPPACRRAKAARRPAPTRRRNPPPP